MESACRVFAFIHRQGLKPPGYQKAKPTEGVENDSKPPMLSLQSQHYIYLDYKIAHHKTPAHAASMATLLLHIAHDTGDHLVEGVHLVDGQIRVGDIDAEFLFDVNRELRQGEGVHQTVGDDALGIGQFVVRVADQIAGDV